MTCKNRKLLSILLLMILFLSSCSIHINQDDVFSEELELGTYLIVTASESTFNPKVFIRAFDEQGNLLSSYSKKNSAWQSVYLEDYIAIVGDSDLILLDLNQETVITLLLDNEVWNISYYKGKFAYTTTKEKQPCLCLFELNEENEYTDNSCVEVGYIMDDVLIHENGIDLIVKEDLQAYLYHYDYQLNFIEKKDLEATGAYFVSDEEKNIFILDDAYVLNQKRISSSSLIDEDLFTYVYSIQDGFIRINYENTGNAVNKRIYLETIENDEVLSLLLFPLEQGKYNVVSTGNTDVISLVSNQDEKYMISFYRVYEDDFLPFNTVLEENETVLGAYFIQ